MELPKVALIEHRFDPQKIEDIPAEVCDVCGDTLLAPEVVERLVKIDVREREPAKFAPVFKYKVMAGI